jgi:hypothetical protein
MLGKVKKANPNERAGVIEDVLSDDPPRYVIRWDSGRATVMAPLPGAIRVEPAKPKTAKSNGRAKASARPAAKASAKTATAKAKPAARASTRTTRSA